MICYCNDRLVSSGHKMTAEKSEIQRERKLRAEKETYSSIP
jgi:hypothetical protein